MTLVPYLIIPAGTQVVTLSDLKDKGGTLLVPKGSVGVIVTSPTDNFHHYRLRFPDGKEGDFLRPELAVRKHYQKEGLGIPDGLDKHELERFVIYRCVVGSRAFGLDTSASDTDIRGIYLPPAEIHWSLYGIPGQLENPEKEECFWELQKFLVLALKANPNVLECLYTPLIEHASPLAQELLAIRELFLSRLVYQTYNGYVLSQFRKLEQDLRTVGHIKWKHAMHLIRLMIQGKAILADGLVPVQVGEFRTSLLEIRDGAWSWEKVDAWRRELHREFEEAFAKTSLPERPDYEKANGFLIHARRAMVEGGP